jgi:hypothetical protein
VASWIVSVLADIHYPGGEWSRFDILLIYHGKSFSPSSQLWPEGGKWSRKTILPEFTVVTRVGRMVCLPEFTVVARVGRLVHDIHFP